MLFPRVSLAFCSVAAVVAAAIAHVARAAQPTSTIPIEGLREASSRAHALVGARVVVSPGQVIENATVVVRDGLIVSVGANQSAPADARVWDVKGRTLFAGFIESDSSLFLPAGWRSGSPARENPGEGPPAGPSAAPPPPAPEPQAGARAWNSRVTPERMASRALIPDPRGADSLRRLGFGVIHVVPERGVFRGQTALVSLGRGSFNTTVIRDSVAQPVAFETGGSYPVSLMGATALLRQTLLDAQWYAEVQGKYAQQRAPLARPEVNDALAALGAVIRGEQPVFFDLDDELDTGRAAALAGEFKLKLVLLGSGYEYRTLQTMPKGVPVIVPLNYPEAPDIENADHAADISLDKLEHWEIAASNAARLNAAGVTLAVTTSGLRRPDTEFWPRLRKTVQHGLPADKALAALTTAPASLLGIEQTHGTVAAGKVANLVVASGDLFSSDDAEIQLVFVDGEPFEFDAWRRFDPRGTWQVAWAEGGKSPPAEIKISGRTANRLRATLGGSEATVRAEGDSFTLLVPGKRVWSQRRRRAPGCTRGAGRVARDGRAARRHAAALAGGAHRDSGTRACR